VIGIEQIDDAAILGKDAVREQRQLGPVIVARVRASRRVWKDVAIRYDVD
jgi:hypothetical protein